MQPSDDISHMRRRWLVFALYGVGLWLVIMVGALLLSLNTLRTLPVGKHMDVAVGPLPCMAIAKEHAASGYILAFQLRWGIGALLFGCVLLEIVVFLFARRTRRSPPDE